MKAASGATTAEASEQPKLLSDIERKMLKKISVDFRETPIDVVLRIMTKQADVDMVKSPQVEGAITATVTDIPLNEALENILGAHGYAYITSDFMIRIVPRSEVNITAETTHSKVYRIGHADTDSVAKSLMQFLSDRGEMAVNVGTSNIMVTIRNRNLTLSMPISRKSTVLLRRWWLKCEFMTCRPAIASIMA